MAIRLPYENDMDNSHSDPALDRHSLFIHEAAAMLGVSRRTVYYRIRQGKLQTVHVGGGTQRVLMESVRQMLRRAAISRES